MKTRNKKPIRNLAKYAMGSGAGGVIKGYMPDPNEVFAQNNIDIAKAQYEASTNPWIQGAKAVGGLAMGVGMNMFSNAGGIKGLTTDLKKFGLGTGPMGSEGVAIETEEGEVLEKPNGQVTKEGGQKHTQGGNQKVVAPGTTIFSDQIMIGGQTMAERKLARERGLAKLTKAVERDASDMLAKNTLKEMSAKYAVEEQQDLEVQEYANQLDETYNYAMGTGKYGVQKFGKGGKVGPDPYVASTFLNNFGELTPEQIAMERLNKVNTEIERHFGNGDLNTSNYKGINLKQFEPQNQQNTPTEVAISTPSGTPGDAAWMAEDNAFWEQRAKDAPAVLADSANANLSLGDMLGMGSSLYGGFAALANTKSNRANTKINENEYRDFGIDALKANEDATNFLSGQQEKQLQDVNLASKDAITTNRNSARGVNQNRAMNAGVFVNTNKAKADIYDNFSKQMLTQLNAKAGLENIQDNMVMQGATVAKGLNDEDTDNYYTQLGADKQGLANMGMNLGKNLNVQKGNQDFLDMLPDLSAYGLGYTRGAKGKLEIQKIKD